MIDGAFVDREGHPMTVVYNLLVTVHLLGMATVLGTVFVEMRRADGPRPWWPVIAAAVQLVSGLALVGIASAGLVPEEVNNTKIAFKLVVALVVLGLAFAATRGRKRQLLHATAILALGNVIIATMW